LPGYQIFVELKAIAYKLLRIVPHGFDIRAFVYLKFIEEIGIGPFVRKKLEQKCWVLEPVPNASANLAQNVPFLSEPLWMPNFPEVVPDKR